MFRRRGIGLVGLLWVIVGVVIALARGYITTALLADVLSAILAIVLWPLVLLGIDLNIQA